MHQNAFDNRAAVFEPYGELSLERLELRMN